MLAASLTPESRDTIPSGIVEGGERKRTAVEVSKAAEPYTAQRAGGVGRKHLGRDCCVLGVERAAEIDAGVEPVPVVRSAALPTEHMRTGILPTRKSEWQGRPLS
jgi:hypothetical protein